MISYTCVEILVEKFGQNILVVQFQLVHSNSGYLQETVGCNGLHKIIIHESLPHLWHVDTVIHTPWLYMSRNTELHTQVVLASNVAQNL